MGYQDFLSAIIMNPIWILCCLPKDFLILGSLYVSLFMGQYYTNLILK